MSETRPYQALTAPFMLAGRRLRNRVVHASMSTALVQNTRMTEGFIHYHASRARGGAAMIVTEPLSMARHQNAGRRLRAWNDDNLDDLKRLADAVEAEDCRLLGQVQDAGRGRHVPGRNRGAVGASALPDDLSWTVPHVLTTAEIVQMIDDFAHSATRLQRCGFSGVEISAGHGHLFHQFFSPWSNRRTDAYGGDWEGRTRFVTELVAAIRELCGRDFIIGLKLPGDDGVPGGIGPDEAAIIAARLTAPGNADYVCFAQGAHAPTLEMHVPDRYGPRLAYMPLIRRLKQAIGDVPLVALGRITDPAEADAIVAQGDAELIGLGRTLVVDPAWLAKATRGRTHDIRYCVSCNTCWGTIVQDRPIACVNNPRVGLKDEVDWWPSPADQRRRVVVIGAGIAGLETAWVAAARGHQVTVFGRSSEVGGKARLRALLPGGETVTSIYDYQLGAAKRAGVRLELGVTATLADVLSCKPDAVVLACGSTMLPPAWLPPDVRDAGLVPDLRDAITDLIGMTARQPGTAVLFDMDHTESTYAAAEFLRPLFDRVVVMTPRDSFAHETPLVTRQGIMRRFSQQRIEMIPLAQPVWNAKFEDGTLDYINVYGGKGGAITDVAFLSYATPRAPDDMLAEPLRAAGIEVHLVGDCLSPQELLAATADGHAAGNTV